MGSNHGLIVKEILVAVSLLVVIVCGGGCTDESRPMADEGAAPGSDILTEGKEEITHEVVRYPVLPMVERTVGTNGEMLRGYESGNGAVGSADGTGRDDTGGAEEGITEEEGATEEGCGGTYEPEQGDFKPEAEDQHDVGTDIPDEWGNGEAGDDGWDADGGAGTSGSEDIGAGEEDGGAYDDDASWDGGGTAGSEADDGNLSYLGEWTISFYCPCAECCGEWATGCTASGVAAEAWHTCATDGLEFGTMLYVDGLGYFEVQDRGTEYGWLDVYVGDHQAAMDLGLQSRTVYTIN